MPGRLLLALLARDMRRMSRMEAAWMVMKYRESASEDSPHPALPGMVMAGMWLSSVSVPAGLQPHWSVTFDQIGVKMN